MPQNPNLSRSPDYYAARAVEERRLAMASNDATAREIHLEMAQKYEQLANRDAVAPPQSIGEDQQRA